MHKNVISFLYNNRNCTLTTSAVLLSPAILYCIQQHSTCMHTECQPGKSQLHIVICYHVTISKPKLHLPGSAFAWLTVLITVDTMMAEQHLKPPVYGQKLPDLGYTAHCSIRKEQSEDKVDFTLCLDVSYLRVFLSCLEK